MAGCDRVAPGGWVTTSGREDAFYKIVVSARTPVNSVEIATKAATVSLVNVMLDDCAAAEGKPSGVVIHPRSENWGVACSDNMLMVHYGRG